MSSLFHTHFVHLHWGVIDSLISYSGWWETRTVSEWYILDVADLRNLIRDRKCSSAHAMECTALHILCCWTHDVSHVTCRLPANFTMTQFSLWHLYRSGQLFVLSATPASLLLSLCTGWPITGVWSTADVAWERWRRASLSTETLLLWTMLWLIVHRIVAALMGILIP